MKRGSQQVFLQASLLLFLLLVSRSASARILLQSNHNQASSMTNVEQEDDDMATLMGSEECNGNGTEDEGCVSRRMIADAHLDYIYTQHHKPKGSP